MLRETLKRLEMRVRTRLPAPVRRAYRVARSLGDVPCSGPLPDALLADCRFCASREAMLDLLPKGGRIAELHLIDIDDSWFDPRSLAGPEVIRHLGLTHEVIATFPDGHFDFIYIDADHSYEGCHRDALAAAPKVKPGGYLAFNDFAHIDPWLGRYGVHRAATDFARAANWPMAFFAFQPAGLYDVAFRRPSQA